MGEPIYRSGTKVKVIREIPGSGTEFWVPLERRNVPVGTEGVLGADLYDLEHTAIVRFPNYKSRPIRELTKYCEVIL